jgi:hypothetical protein
LKSSKDYALKKRVILKMGLLLNQSGKMLSHFSAFFVSRLLLKLRLAMP